MLRSEKDAPAKSVFRVVIVGDAETGKSALLQRLIDDTFPNEYNPTIGAEFGSKVLGDVKLQIWCTAGQECFKALTRSYCQDGDAFILTYDISNRASFENIKAWVDDIKRSSNPDYDAYYLVGTKYDLEGKRVTDLSAVKFMDLGIPEGNCFEVSAKNGSGVNELFEKIADDLSPKTTIKMTPVAKNNADDKKRPPTFLQKHRGKIIGGIIGIALTLLIASFAFPLWPLIVALPVVTAGVFGVTGGLFAGISIGCIAAASTAISFGIGSVVDAITTAANGNKKSAASVSPKINNASSTKPRDESTGKTLNTLGVDLGSTTMSSEATFLLDNAASNQPLSPETSPRQEAENDSPRLGK